MLVGPSAKGEYKEPLGYNLSRYCLKVEQDAFLEHVAK